MPKEICLYTDGACSGNPGPGGWGAILTYNGNERVLFGGEPKTTNNRMELTAVIQGLSALRERCQVTIYSDSKYVLDAIEKGWAKKWQQNGWMRGKGQPALNPDLWEKLLSLLEGHDIKLCWIRGHAGHPMNERCDQLAVAESQKFK